MIQNSRPVIRKECLARFFNLYKEQIKERQRSWKRELTFAEKAELVDSLERIKFELALLTPGIRVYEEDEFHSDDKQCLDLFSENENSSLEIKEGLVYEFNRDNRTLHLSISPEDKLKILGEVTVNGFGFNGLHIEIIMKDQKFFVHCFRLVQQIVSLDPTPDGKYLLKY